MNYRRVRETEPKALKIPILGRQSVRLTQAYSRDLLSIVELDLRNIRSHDFSKSRVGAGGESKSVERPESLVL